MSLPSNRQQIEKLVREALHDVLKDSNAGFKTFSNTMSRFVRPAVSDPAEIIFAANWKMNMTIQETLSFVRDFQPPSDPRKQVIICPPAYLLIVLIRALSGKPIRMGAQNMFWEERGAFTGEQSPTMMRDAGCDYVILGHSERRHIFGEEDNSINRKVQVALSHGLIPIFCVGETLSEREQGATFRVLSNQLRIGLSQVSLTETQRLVLAYEPVWAIGTGKTATPETAQEAQAYIRELLGEILDHHQAHRVRILYGGSVRPTNAASLIDQPDIDGFLVGGASLEVETFQEICRVG
ncbi:MAG: triose-phosphate isomerase [Candidatus Heimdallarchaeota archaeon]